MKNLKASQRANESNFKLKFTVPKQMQHSEHLDTLATAKPDYYSKDFFAQKEFRGLVLSDYQEAVGSKAFQAVEDLNESVLSKFKTLQNFNKQIKQGKMIKSFYKQVVIPQLKENSSSESPRITADLNRSSTLRTVDSNKGAIINMI